MAKVSLADFASSFGTSVEDIARTCGELIGQCNFTYRTLEGEERDKMILSALKKIETDAQVIGAPSRKDDWQRGWNENFENFVASNYSLDSLIPKFIRPNQPIRFQQDYILPENPMFELDFLRVFRQWLFETYLGEASSVYEFGSGTGFNLVALAQVHPEKKLYGLDFVPPARDLVNLIAEKHHWNMTGKLFDMIHPDESLELDTNSAIMTLGAMEQLASKFEAFLQFLLRQSPRICIHMEPTVELYDETNLVDYLAMKFHRKRGYTEGFLPRLRELEKERKLEVLKVQRLYFGSAFMEGYMYMVWRPLPVAPQTAG